MVALANGYSVPRQVLNLSRVPGTERGCLRHCHRGDVSKGSGWDQKVWTQRNGGVKAGREMLQTSGDQSLPAVGPELTLQAVPIGAGAGGRRGGLGSNHGCKCTLLFHGRDHVGWWEGEDARGAAAVGGEACRWGHGGAGWHNWENKEKRGSHPETRRLRSSDPVTLLWPFLGRAFPKRLKPCPVSFVTWCLTCATFKWVTSVNLLWAYCMPGSMESLVSQTASRGVGLIPFIQPSRSQHMKHALEEDTESPSSEFPGQENKSPTPS